MLIYQFGTRKKKKLVCRQKGWVRLIKKLPIILWAGIMHSAEALSAWFNPTINSYKRINAPVTASGATWSPNTITLFWKQ